MVIDPALADAGQGRVHRPYHGLVRPAQPAAQDQLYGIGLREFWRLVNAAMHRVHLPAHGLRRPVQEFDVNPDSRGLGIAGGKLVQGLQHGFGIFAHGVRVRMIDFGDAPHDIGKTRPAVTRLGWKIGAAPERFSRGRQEHGQGPAALLSHQTQRRHIDRVNVRAFFPVHLDIDEQLVHQVSDGGIFETFMGHDMAPMTSGVADR